MSDSTGRNFPNRGITQGHMHFDLITSGLYRYVGGDPSDLTGSWLLVEGELVGHPDTSEWGLTQSGARWFNKALGHFYGWDGVQIVQLSAEIA